MDVDSPRIMPREVVESPLITASYPDRTSTSSRDRSPSPRTKKLSGLVTNVSPVTKAKLWVWDWDWRLGLGTGIGD